MMKGAVLMGKNRCLIRCRNKIDGRSCGNPICVLYENTVIVRRKGREVSFLLQPFQTVRIICEKCKKETFVSLKIEEDKQDG